MGAHCVIDEHKQNFIQNVYKINVSTCKTKAVWKT